MRPQVADVDVDDDDDSALIDLEDKVSELARLFYGLPETLKVKFEFEAPVTQKVSVSKMYYKYMIVCFLCC